MANLTDIFKKFKGTEVNYSMPASINTKMNGVYVYSINSNTAVSFADDLSYVSLLKKDNTRLYTYTSNIIIWQNTNNTSTLSLEHGGQAIPIEGNVDVTKCNLIAILRLPVNGSGAGSVYVAKVIAKVEKHIATSYPTQNIVDPPAEEPVEEPGEESGGEETGSEITPTWSQLTNAIDNAGVLQITDAEGNGIYTPVFNKVDGNYVSLEYQSDALTPSFVVGLSDSATAQGWGSGAWVDHGMFYNPGASNDLATVLNGGDIVNEVSPVIGQIARMRVAGSGTQIIYEYSNDGGTTFNTVRTETISETAPLYITGTALYANKQGVVKILNNAS